MGEKLFIEEFFGHLDKMPGSKIEMSADADGIKLSFIAPSGRKYSSYIERPAYDNKPETLQSDLLNAISILAYGSAHDSSQRGGIRP